MWLILKVFAVVAGFICRWYAKHLRLVGTELCEVNGIKFYLKVHKSKYGVESVSFGIPFHSRSLFKITPQSKWDHFFMRLGLANEVQTGDASFDRAFFIASDCSAFRHELRKDSSTRDLIEDAFGGNGKSISADGKTLWFHYKGDPRGDEALLNRCFNFHKWISTIDQKWPGGIGDPYLIKTILIEGIIWSIAGYSVVGFMEWALASEDLHLHPYQLMKYGVLFGLVASVIFVLLVAFVMQGSSRAHRIVRESIIVLLLVFPFGGMHLISDLNTHLDRNESYLVEAQVLDMRVQEHRGRRGRRSYSYHMQINPKAEPQGLALPRSIRVSNSDYQRFKSGQTIEIQIGPGYFKSPWYKSFSHAKWD